MTDLKESRIQKRFNKCISKDIHMNESESLRKWPLLPPVVFIRIVIQKILFLLMRTFQPFKVEGRENLQLHSPVIFIANHMSHLDTPSLLKCLPLTVRKKIVVAAAADYFFKNWLIAFVTRLLFNTFPIERNGQIRKNFFLINKFLERGWSILVYPEGTRSQTGKIQPFKNGIGILAQLAKIPIVPLKISGTFDILPKGCLLPRKGRTEIRIEKPIRFEAGLSYIQITKQLELYYQTLDGQSV